MFVNIVCRLKGKLTPILALRSLKRKIQNAAIFSAPISVRFLVDGVATQRCANMELVRQRTNWGEVIKVSVKTCNVQICVHKSRVLPIVVALVDGILTIECAKPFHMVKLCAIERKKECLANLNGVIFLQ